MREKISRGEFAIALIALSLAGFLSYQVNRWQIDEIGQLVADYTGSNSATDDNNGLHFVDPVTFQDEVVFDVDTTCNDSSVRVMVVSFDIGDSVDYHVKGVVRKFEVDKEGKIFYIEDGMGNFYAVKEETLWMR